MSEGNIRNEPLRPSNGARRIAFPAEDAFTATSGPDTKLMRQSQRPLLSGERCARHLSPAEAEEFAASPSAAKYPGTW